MTALCLVNQMFIGLLFSAKSQKKRNPNLRFNHCIWGYFTVKGRVPTPKCVSGSSLNSPKKLVRFFFRCHCKYVSRKTRKVEQLWKIITFAMSQRPLIPLPGTSAPQLNVRSAPLPPGFVPFQACARAPSPTLSWCLATNRGLKSAVFFVVQDEKNRDMRIVVNRCSVGPFHTS